MKYAVAVDDDGDFAVVQLIDRKRLWKLLKEDICGGDAWANRDGEIPVDNADDFNALSEEQLIDVVREVRDQGGKLEIMEVETSPVTTQAVDKPALPVFVDDVEAKRRQWRKTTLAFAMAYPDWFGPENGMIGSDIVENALHVLDIMPFRWIKHIVSVNPTPNLKVEIMFGRDNGRASMQVGRSGIMFHISKDDGTDIEGAGGCDKEGLEEFDCAWDQVTLKG